MTWESASKPEDRSRTILLTLLCLGFGGFLAVSFQGTGVAGMFESHSQVTFGGAEYFVTGTIEKIEDGYYFVREPGEEVARIKVTKDTNMVCPTRPTMQKDRHTNTTEPTSAGFRIGNCPFQVGEKVKVEVDDLGVASYVRIASRPAESQTAELGLPQRYMVLPVQYGDLIAEPSKPLDVKTADGETIGILKRVVLDATLGQVVFGIVNLKDDRLLAVPWQAVERDPANEHIRIQLTQQHLVHIPTFRERVSVHDVKRFWDREFGQEDWRKGPYSARWVKNIVREIKDLPRVQREMKNDPHLPGHIIALLNLAADHLNANQIVLAQNDFSKALRELDWNADQGHINRDAADQMKAAIILHAPRQAAKQIRRMTGYAPAVSMARAIEIAQEQHPGKLISADYLGEFGQNAYQMRIMAGTGITRLIEVHGDTGKVRVNRVIPGHPMPNEPLR